MAITFPSGTTYTIPEDDTTSTQHTATRSVTGNNSSSLVVNYFNGVSHGNTYSVANDVTVSKAGDAVTFNYTTVGEQTGQVTYYYQGYYNNGINASSTDESNYTILLSSNPNGSGERLAVTSAPSKLLATRKSYDGYPDSISTDTGTLAGFLYHNGGAVPDVDITECFLAGAMIETAAGFKAIENISMTDEIVAYGNDDKAPRKIKAVLKRRVTVRDRMDYPVRFRKDAIAPGIPSEDLMVTSEHCMYFEGRFIPARMLVNGRTITAEDHMSSFDVYHVEFEDHAIINASGMLTESFLATGKSYKRGNGVFLHSVGTKTWEDDAAAPLTTDTTFVEPLYLQFDNRATDLGYEARKEPELVQDPDLHMITQDGQTLKPLRITDGNRYVFQLRDDVTSVTLVSRTARPSETVGPFCDDRRDLGVLVGDITLFESHTHKEITDHLTAETLPGWDVREASPCRWTNGAAQIDFGARTSMTSGMLCVQVLAAGPYLAETSVIEQAMQKAG